MVPIFGEECYVPKSLGDLELNAVIVDENEKLGFQARYEKVATKCDLYIYDFGLFPLPDDVKHEIVLNHFRDCVGGIVQLSDIGAYSDFVLGPSDGLQFPVNNSEKIFLHSQCEFSTPDSEISIDIGMQRSHLMLTTMKGYFLKIRCSYPKHDRDERIQVMYAFVLDSLKTIDEFIA